MQVAIRTKVDTFHWGVGKSLIESLGDGGELLCLEQISHNPDKFTEPFLGKSECEKWWATKGSLRVNGSLSEYYEDFAWRRKKAVKSSGYIRHKAVNIRSQIVPGTLSFRSGCSEKINWLLLFRAWCEIFSPQLGMLHRFGGFELDSKNKNNSFQIGSFNSALKPDVPNIGWAMFYGDEFAEEIDVDRIAASGFPIEKIGSGYLVRVTENIQDVVNDFPFFSKRRAELKALFQEGFFLIQGEPVL